MSFDPNQFAGAAARRRLIASLGAAAGAGLLPALGRAQSGPGIDTVRFVTGFAPGGTSDTTCRRVAEKLKGTYAKNAVVENRTGGGGQLAIDLMRAAPRDGSTILQTPASMLVIYPHIYRKLSYDPVNDVTPCSLACSFDFGFAVGPMVPANVRSVNDFIQWCRANPDKANFGSPAAGSTPHFVGALLGMGTKVDLKHVAFRGTQPAILDMIGGQIAAVSGPVGEFIQHVQAGKCRLLATSGEKRSRFAPDVPTFAEQGYKDLIWREWFGFYLPGKPEQAVLQRANAAIRAALAEKDTIEGLATMGLEAESSSPEQLAALQRRDFEHWGPIVKAIGFTADS